MSGLRNPVIYSTFVAGAFAFCEPAPAQSARDLCAKETGDKAIAACDKAIADNPKDADSYSNRGFSWSAKGDQDKAIADFNEALKINPKHVRALSNRGVAWNRKGDPDRAIADATEAIKVNKRHAKAYNNRAVALIRKREYRQGDCRSQRIHQAQSQGRECVFQPRQRSGNEGFAFGRIGGFQEICRLVSE